MQAQGNDFIILDGFAWAAKGLNYSDFAIEACAFHTGIGADGLVLMLPSENADGQMLIYNSNGSQAEMCGSALRCVAYLLHNKLNKRELAIQTDSGLLAATVSPEGIVTVNLGMPKIIHKAFSALGFSGDLVDIGNLHFIIWQNDLDSDPHLLHGARLENYQGFPQAVNVHFAKLLSPTEVQIKIWERGCGATLACGTGAVSTVFSARQRELVESSVQVNMPGGAVQIEALETGYLLRGEVAFSFSGDYHWRI